MNQNLENEPHKQNPTAPASVPDAQTSDAERDKNFDQLEKSLNAYRSSSRRYTRALLILCGLGAAVVIVILILAR